MCIGRRCEDVFEVYGARGGCSDQSRHNDCIVCTYEGERDRSNSKLKRGAEDT